MTGRLLFGETPEYSSILVDQSKILSFDLTPTKSRCQSRKFSFGRKEKNSSSQILRHNILRKSLFLATRRRVYGNWTLLEKWRLSGEEINHGRLSFFGRNRSVPLPFRSFSAETVPFLCRSVCFSAPTGPFFRRPAIDRSKDRSITVCFVK